jgi:hypothetical protein
MYKHRPRGQCTKIDDLPLEAIWVMNGLGGLEGYKITSWT